MRDVKPWIVPTWRAPSRVHALMTTRDGGVSEGPWGGGSGGGLNLGTNTGDDPETVAANRRRLAGRLPAEPAWLRQVHGTRAVSTSVVEATRSPVEADASHADRPASVCTVLVADCMPVLFCDRRATRVAAAHAGWRGLVGGVLEETLAQSGLVPDETLAWIGPAIGPTRFEVGDEVRDAFVASHAAHAMAFVAGADGKWLADLPMMARQRLLACGVTDVTDSGLCTASDASRFYSYRRDGVTGRMAALIWLDH